ncbi:MAG: PAS domain S-box protein, partial [Chloroflexota bacterium]
MAKSKKTKKKPDNAQQSSQKEIAKLKIAVDQQKMAHSLHTSILDSLSHPIFAVDSEYKYLVFNQEHIAAMKAIYNVDIALGKSILGYMSVSEDRKSAKANIDRALAGETVIVRQFAGDANLDRRHYEITHAPFADDISGTGVIVLVQDITNLESANLRFKKFFQAVEYSPVSIAVTDLDGALEYVNPKFCELTGYTFEESIGENPRILQSEFTEKETYSQLWETILAGKEWKGEFVNKKKNGELYYESASISP